MSSKVEVYQTRKKVFEFSSSPDSKNYYSIESSVTAVKLLAEISMDRTKLVVYEKYELEKRQVSELKNFFLEILDDQVSDARNNINSLSGTVGHNLKTID